MAQDSAVWDGTTTGDAYSITKWNAPYTDDRWSDIMDYLLAASLDGGYVLPGYANNLNVISSSPADMNIHLSTGVMFIRGRLYENTADKSLTVVANASANPRIDRIVIRVNFSAQTIRVFIKQGTAAVLPAIPKLTRTSATYEVPVAYIWVASGAASIANEEIHDERIFASTVLGYQTSPAQTNQIRNSEFMGFSELSEALTTNTNPPDLWDLVSTPSNIANYTKPAQMIRGRAVQITANGASEGISQTIAVKPSTMYAIKVLVRVDSGSDGSISVTTDSAAPTTITRSPKRALIWTEEKVFYLTEADATSMTIKLMALANGDVVQYGQLIAVEGYIPGPFRQIHETILFTKAVTDSLWNNTVVTTTSSVSVYYDQRYQKIIPTDIKAVLVYLELIETSTNFLSSYLNFLGPQSLRLYVSGYSPGTYYTQGWVAKYGGSNPQNSVSTQYTVFGTLTVTAKILGIEV